MTDLLTRPPREGAARTRGRVRLAPAGPADGVAVAVLFEALHDHNATPDPRFALADDWRSLLDDHFARTRETTVALAWSPNGRLPAAAAAGGPIFLFEGATGRLTRVLSGHGGGTLALDWRPDGAMLTSAGQDGAARLWPLASVDAAEQVLPGGAA